MSVTALDILRACREYAADPEHIVTEPHHVYENASGDFCEPDGAIRGCVLGVEGIVCRRLGVDDTAHVEKLAWRAIDAAIGGDYLGTMRAGHAEILAAYDRAIASLEASP